MGFLNLIIESFIKLLSNNIELENGDSVNKTKLAKTKEEVVKAMGF